MRKSTRKILSILIAVAMIFTLIPFGVMAASSGPKKASESTLGRADGDYTLTIVNDAETVMLFDVQVNGEDESLSFAAGETLGIGINAGDTFSVEKIGNSNYNVVSESGTFQSGDYENVIAKEFTHKVGDGFKTGERSIYVQKDGSQYEGDTETISGNLAVKGSKIEAPLAIKSNNSSNAVLGITVNGVEQTTTVSGNFANSNTNSTTAQNNGRTLTTAANNFFATIVDQIPGYDADRYAILNGTIEGKTVSSGGCNSTTTTEYTVTASPAVYIPLDETIIDIKDDVAAGDITLTYTTETTAKAGNFSVNLLNQERLSDLHSKLTINTVTSLMSLMTGTNSEGSEGSGMSTDTFTNLLGNEDLMSLIGIEALDNMPKGFDVVLTEVDKGDGLYEGLVYHVPMTNTMFIHIDMDVMMQDALGSTLFNLAKGQIPAEMLDMEITLPVSIGQSFAQEGVRAGQYEVKIVSPGEGWYAATDTYTINVTNGGTVNNLGGSHVYGSIRTSALIDPLTSAMGMDLGCLGSLAGLMLGSNTVKFVNTTGIEVSHKQNHIEFTNATLNVDENGKVTTTGIPGATFTLVDRDRFLELVDTLLAMGREAVNSVIGGISFDELLGLREEITEGDPEEPVDAEPGMIERVLLSIIALGPEGLDGFQVPAILENVADENGLVTFDPKDNVTLKKLIDLIPLLTNAVSGIGDIAGGIGGLIPGSGDSEEPGEPGEEPGEGETPAEPSGSGSSSSLLSGLDMATVLDLLAAVGDEEQIGLLLGLLDSFSGLMGGGDSEEPTEPTEPTDPTDPTDPSEPGEPAAEQPDMMSVIMDLLNNENVDISGDLGFALLNFIGLTDGRFPTGNYLLIQSAVPEGRTRNPMMYVFENTWDAEEREYHTYASVDIGGVMSNEQFAVFAGQLEQSYELLTKIFGNLAEGADGGLSLARAFVGEEGEGYNSQVLFDWFNDLSLQVSEWYNSQNNPDPENPAEAVSLLPLELREALGQILDAVLDTYIPKATVLTYVSRLIYENTGSLFESQEEVAELITSLALNGEYTFTDFNNKVQQLLDQANFVLNGEVTKNWYYYDVSANIFTNINVAYHYVINMILPPELANVVERALQGDIDAGEAMIDELINQIINPDTGEVEVPDEPDEPDLPGTNTGSWLSRLFGGLFGGGSGGGSWFSNLFGGGSSGGIGGFFRNLFGGWF